MTNTYQPDDLPTDARSDRAVVAKAIRRRATRGAAAVAGLLVGAALLAACNDKPSFAVGDCVRIEDRLLDSDLERADCSTARGTFNAVERTYKVDQIIDDTDGGCPSLRGFFPVEFVHEPDGVTYCLSQAGG